jgi:nitroimidazol reductase NimA-like FMN-containing flavoprotein (pyridoxamine 5'-phosphate oxidase superfamily)
MKIVEDSLTESIDAFLERLLFAHLATTSAEGPRESPVWFLHEDEAIWVIGDETDSFPRRIERDPQCAVGIVAFERRNAIVKHVGIRGRASVEPFDPDRAERLLVRYIGENRRNWDPMFRAVFETPDEHLLVRVEPETIVARDQSYMPSLG